MVLSSITSKISFLLNNDEIKPNCTRISECDKWMHIPKHGVFTTPLRLWEQWRKRIEISIRTERQGGGLQMQPFEHDRATGSMNSWKRHFLTLDLYKTGFVNWWGTTTSPAELLITDYFWWRGSHCMLISESIVFQRVVPNPMSTQTVLIKKKL